MSVYSDRSTHTHSGSETTTFPDLTELYWNVTGDEWEVPIKQVWVTVTAADSAKLGSQQYCYEGVSGSNDACASRRLLSEKTAMFSSGFLAPHDQLTIAQEVRLPQSPVVLEKIGFSSVLGAIDPELVSIYIFLFFWILIVILSLFKKELRGKSKPLIFLVWLLVFSSPFAAFLYSLVSNGFRVDLSELSFFTKAAWIGGPVILAIIALKAYLWRKEFAIDRTVIAQYEPYQDFKPMLTGVLIDNGLDPRDITAVILYLAQRGHIKIRQKKEKVHWLFETTDYEIIILKEDVGDKSKTFDDELLRLLFDQSSDPNSVMKQLLLSILNSQVNNDSSREPISIDSSLQLQKHILLSEIRKNVSKQRTNSVLLIGLRKAVQAKLEKDGFI